MTFPAMATSAGTPYKCNLIERKLGSLTDRRCVAAFYD